MIRRLLACLLLLISGLAEAQFDHRHAAWNALVAKHVHWLPDNKQSQVDYAGFQRDRGELKLVLDAMSAVPQAEFDTWLRAERLAFLINAYNGFTVELILTRYPDLKSIKELGSFVQSAWKQKFFSLLGEPRHLEVSAIFKWFEADFERGEQGFGKVEDVFAKYAALLSDKPEEQARLRSGAVPVTHLEYDWSLNGVRR